MAVSNKRRKTVKEKRRKEWKMKGKRMEIGWFAVVKTQLGNYDIVYITWSDILRIFPRVVIISHDLKGVNATKP